MHFHVYSSYRKKSDDVAVKAIALCQAMRVSSQFAVWVIVAAQCIIQWTKLCAGNRSRHCGVQSSHHTPTFPQTDVIALV
jgi:hypothetical protein